MTNQNYTAWRPLELNLKADISSITLDDCGLSCIFVIFGNVRRSLKLHFSRLRAYRVADEGYRLNTFGCFNPAEYSLVFVVDNSAYVAQFKAECLGTMDKFPLIHWFLVSENDCVDVLSEQEPALTWDI